MLPVWRVPISWDGDRRRVYRFLSCQSGMWWSYLVRGAGQPNETWQSDFTHYPPADGSDTETITWPDDHARFGLTRLGAPPHHRPDRLRNLDSTAAQHGSPASVLTDKRLRLHHPVRRRPRWPQQPQQPGNRATPPRHRPEELPPQPPTTAPGDSKLRRRADSEFTGLADETAATSALLRHQRRKLPQCHAHRDRNVDHPVHVDGMVGGRKDHRVRLHVHDAVAALRTGGGCLAPSGGTRRPGPCWTPAPRWRPLPTRDVVKQEFDQRVAAWCGQRRLGARRAGRSSLRLSEDTPNVPLPLLVT